MASSKLMMVVAVIVIASFYVPSTMAQTRHTVGGNTGWTIPNGGDAFYTTWASGQNFNVGDTLVFNFTTGSHDVAEVTQTSYGPCTTAGPITRNTTGPLTVTLTTPGNHYYICTIRAGAHCQAGQKLMINVGGSNSTTPAPTGSMTPPPAGTASPPPPSPSSASSFTTVLPVTILVAALALLY